MRNADDVIRSTVSRHTPPPLSIYLISLLLPGEKRRRGKGGGREERIKRPRTKSHSIAPASRRRCTFPHGLRQNILPYRRNSAAPLCEENGKKRDRDREREGGLDRRVTTVSRHVFRPASTAAIATGGWAIILFPA